MNWSFSQSLSFRTCPRKWFFMSKVGNALAKAPLRREAFFLSKLQSVSAWRGDLVDEVISTLVIPIVAKKLPVSIDEILSKARELFDAQLAFAREKRWREDGVKTSTANYVALDGYQYGQDISLELDQAWLDIEQALNNFFALEDLWANLSEAAYLIPQKWLRFLHYGVWVTCRPDLIILYKDDPPMIVDWKVHTFGIRDYRLQLAIYALALIRSNQSKKLPASITGYTAPEVGLLEVQLLTGKQRPHHLSDEDFEEVENYISTSAEKMLLAATDDDEEPVSYLDIPCTSFADACSRCAFRGICWEGSEWEKEIRCQGLKQISFLC